MRTPILPARRCVCRCAPPSVPAGTSPPQGGRSTVGFVVSPDNKRLILQKRLLGTAPRIPIPISPLEGEMPGRAEGGAHRQTRRFVGGRGGCVTSHAALHATQSQLPPPARHGRGCRHSHSHSHASSFPRPWKGRGMHHVLPSGHEGVAGARGAPRMNKYMAHSAPRFGFCQRNFGLSAPIALLPGFSHAPGGDSLCSWPGEGLAGDLCFWGGAFCSLAPSDGLVATTQARPRLIGEPGRETSFCAVPCRAAATA
ncbi:hypothetical protein GGR23_003012 [Gellertiella hungarica]|uniref:Uncharacterized protein n=1 Tax=Gellertiella hungarica TaxID=1572859 RepID=A0A7W6J6Q5_9HYPH|nr:hypothetical protein [Gellertiella hungarica]